MGVGEGHFLRVVSQFIQQVAINKRQGGDPTGKIIFMDLAFKELVGKQ
jgi:hypothetical protein